MGAFLRVRNLEKYQHYKDRNPPWVKLYNITLEDYEFEALPDATKWHALSLVLLASRLDNKIPADPGWIQRHTGSKSAVNLEALIACNFLEHDASNSLADCKQDAIPEREGETETEREAEARIGQGESVDQPPRAATNGKVPEKWLPVYFALSKSPNLNRPKLFNWDWWDTIATIHADHDIEILTEFAKMEEFFVRKPQRARQIRDWQRFVKNWLSTAAEAL